MLCARTVVLRSGTVVLCAGTELLCRPFVLCPQVLPSPLPSVPPSLLQEELLRSRLLRAHLLRSGTDLLCAGTELLCRPFVLCAEVLPSPLPPVPPSLLQEELLRPGLLRAQLLCSG